MRLFLLSSVLALSSCVGVVTETQWRRCQLKCLEHNGLKEAGKHVVNDRECCRCKDETVIYFDRLPKS